MAKKSFLKKLLILVAQNAESSEMENISKHRALRLQKDYVNSLKQERKRTITPPYKEIMKQLNAEKSEIFRAAVYYLLEIADNEQKYHDEIIAELQTFLQNSKRSKEDLEYLSKQLQKVAKSTSVLI